MKHAIKPSFEDARFGSEALFWDKICPSKPNLGTFVCYVEGIHHPFMYVSHDGDPSMADAMALIPKDVTGTEFNKIQLDLVEKLRMEVEKCN